MNTAKVIYDPATGIVQVQVEDSTYTGSVPDAIEAFSRFAELVTNRETIEATHNLLAELRRI